MFTHTLLPMLITALLLAPTPAQTPTTPKQVPRSQNSESKTAETSGANNDEDTTDPEIIRYRKKVNSAIGARWNFHIQKQKAEIKLGKVTILISIDAAGKLKSFRITENTSDDAHAKLVEKSVRESEFEPPPPVALKDGVYETPLNFFLL